MKNVVLIRTLRIWGGEVGRDRRNAAEISLIALMQQF
jgi:hypothetical protein